MPEDRRGNGRGELGNVAGFVADAGDAVAGDRLGDPVSGKEPGLQWGKLPGASQQREEVRGAQHQAIALACALTHVEHQALGVASGPLEVTKCRDPHARGLAGGQARTRREGAWSQHHRFHLVAPEHDRACLGLLGVGERVDPPRTAQGRLGEKASGTPGLENDALGDLRLEQRELRGAEVRGPEAIG